MKKKERLEWNQIIADKFTLSTLEVDRKDEKAPQSIDGFIKKEVPFVYITDLSSFVIDLLNTYRNTGKLT